VVWCVFLCGVCVVWCGVVCVYLYGVFLCGVCVCFGVVCVRVCGPGTDEVCIENQEDTKMKKHL
jgi:hypothetical protein